MKYIVIKLDLGRSESFPILSSREASSAEVVFFKLFARLGAEIVKDGFAPNARVALENILKDPYKVTRKNNSLRVTMEEQQTIIAPCP